MKRIPKVLPSFRDWMKKEAVNQYFIFYEYSKKGATVGYCSHCGKEVPIENPSHNKESKCCKCGAEIQYKVTSKIKTLGTRKYTGQLIQKMKGGVVIRSFEGQQWYRDVDYRQPNSYLSETERILLFDNGTMKRYVYDMYKNKKLRWILDKGYTPYIRTYYWQRTIKVYKRNLASLKRTVLKNSAIDLWETLPTDVANYLVMERGNPAIEKLAKIGMFNLAKGLMKATYNAKLLDEGATELTKMLKIDAARLKRLKAINGDVSHLKWFQYEKSADKVFPDELIKDFGDVGIESISDFDFIPIPLSLVKVWNYLKKQSAMCGESLERVRRTWMDYLNMAKKAKLNVKSDMIAKPKDLKAKHQEVILICRAERWKKKLRNWQRSGPR